MISIYVKIQFCYQYFNEFLNYPENKSVTNKSGNKKDNIRSVDEY